MFSFQDAHVPSDIKEGEEPMKIKKIHVHFVLSFVNKPNNLIRK